MNKLLLLAGIGVLGYVLLVKPAAATDLAQNGGGGSGITGDFSNPTQTLQGEGLGGGMLPIVNLPPVPNIFQSPAAFDKAAEAFTTPIASNSSASNSSGLPSYDSLFQKAAQTKKQAQAIQTAYIDKPKEQAENVISLIKTGKTKKEASNSLYNFKVI